MKYETKTHPVVLQIFEVKLKLFQKVNKLLPPPPKKMSKSYADDWFQRTTTDIKNYENFPIIKNVQNLLPISPGERIPHFLRVVCYCFHPLHGTKRVICHVEIVKQCR